MHQNKLSHKFRSNRKCNNNVESLERCHIWYARLQNTLKNYPEFDYDKSNPDHKYGPLPPKFMYNIDQIPMPFLLVFIKLGQMRAELQLMFYVQ